MEGPEFNLHHCLFHYSNKKSLYLCRCFSGVCSTLINRNSLKMKILSRYSELINTEEPTQDKNVSKADRKESQNPHWYNSSKKAEKAILLTWFLFLLFLQMVATKSLPLVLGSLLGIMLAILVVVLFLFYKKRKESMEFNIPLEKMTRGLKSSFKKKTSSSKSSRSSNDSIHIKPQGVSFYLFDSVFPCFPCIWILAIRFYSF